MTNGYVMVELYGVPRRRAGVASLEVPAGTLAAVLAGIEHSCPKLAGLLEGNRLNPHYLVSLDGRRFLDDLSTPLQPGERLLLLSADAGG